MKQYKRINNLTGWVVSYPATVYCLTIEPSEFGIVANLSHRHINWKWVTLQVLLFLC